MKEISLHILDLFYNSLKADASIIKIKVRKDSVKDLFTVKIVDNGCGMDKEFLKNVISPFTTTRTTRKVGLGIPLFRESALRCEGDFKILSKKNLGTVVEATYKDSHIDRAPLGDMVDTITSMVMAIGNNVDLIYDLSYNDKHFVLDTREIRKILGDDVSLQTTDVINWLKEYIKEETKTLEVN